MDSVRIALSTRRVVWTVGCGLLGVLLSVPAAASPDAPAMGALYDWDPAAVASGDGNSSAPQGIADTWLAEGRRKVARRDAPCAPDETGACAAAAAETAMPVRNARVSGAFRRLPVLELLDAGAGLAGLPLVKPVLSVFKVGRAMRAGDAAK